MEDLSISNDDEDSGEIKPRHIERSGFKTHGQSRKPWEPTAEQLSVYEAVRCGKSYRQVAAIHEVTYQYVGQLCRKIDDWLAQQYMSRVRQLRARHTQQLEHIFTEAMEAWEKSKEPAVTIETQSVTLDVEDADGGEIEGQKSKTKKEFQCGAPAFLKEARGALQDIRKIWAVDKNPRIVDPGDSDDEYRVAGKSREQVIEEKIQRLKASLGVSKAMNSEQAG